MFKSFTSKDGRKLSKNIVCRQKIQVINNQFSMYTVLARKYRSQVFDEVIGQEPIAQTLKNAIKTGRVAHAYLFTGTRGVGKTTMARILAKSLNCLSVDKPTTEPCLKCDSCIAVNTGEDIDVLEIDGASNNSVDQVRALRENAIYRPARARFKIYIIDEVHMLSTSAFNALLKILEEPPSHVKFIFATTEPNKVIATVQSRCQRFDFNNIPPAKIAEQLKSICKQEKIKYEDDLIPPLAKMANGSMRDGLSLLDRLISTGSESLTAGMLEQYLGCPNSEKVQNLVVKIAQSDAAGTLEAIDDLTCSGLGESQIADALTDYMRDLMLIKATGTDSDILILTEQQRDKAVELSEGFDTAALIYNITALEKLRWSLKNSETARALLEAALLRLALSEHFIDVDKLLEKPTPTATRDIKKNQTPINNPPVQSVRQPEGPLFRTDATESSNLSHIKANWHKMLKSAAAELGNGTVGLLSSAEPTGLDNNCLVITFPSTGKMAKKMCEEPARFSQIQKAVSGLLKEDTKVRFEIAEQADTDKTASWRENEIINDPAVKTILTELGATITDIEELIIDD
jgi:DNA polymerase-3 subunit gamma/tau